MILTSAQIGTRLEALARMTGEQIGTWLEAQARRVAPGVAFVYAGSMHVLQQYKRITTTVAAAHAAWIGDDWRFEPVAPAVVELPMQGPLPMFGPSLPPVAAQPVVAQPVVITDRKPVVISTRHRAPLTVENLIASHTQRELMVIAGTKSKRSKKVLAEKIIREELFSHS